VDAEFRQNFLLALVGQGQFGHDVFSLHGQRSRHSLPSVSGSMIAASGLVSVAPKAARRRGDRSSSRMTRFSCARLQMRKNFPHLKGEIWGTPILAVDCLPNLPHSSPQTA
jgi:hypothetical protein